MAAEHQRTRVRHWALLAVVLTAAPLVVGLPDAAVAKNAACTQSRTSTVAGSATIRVHRDRGKRVYACWRASGKRVRLDGWALQVTVDEVSDRYVALRGVDSAAGEHGGEIAYVQVFDVQRGRALLSTTGFLDEQADTPLPQVDPVSLVRGGGLVWSAQNTLKPGAPREVYVQRTDRGPTTVLDSSVGIEPASIATNATDVYWVRDGVAQTASLPAM